MTSELVALGYCSAVIKNSLCVQEEIGIRIMVEIDKCNIPN